MTWLQRFGALLKCVVLIANDRHCVPGRYVCDGSMSQSHLQYNTTHTWHGILCCALSHVSQEITYHQITHIIIKLYKIKRVIITKLLIPALRATAIAGKTQSLNSFSLLHILVRVILD